MSLELENIDEVIDDLRTRVTLFKASVSKAFSRVDEQVVAQFRDEQLSGRHADDTGLNIRTGTLHDSIKSLVEVSDSEISGVVYNTDAQYWQYHQEGMGHNPKRLFFDEYFASHGLRLYTEAVEESLSEMVL